MILFPQLTQAGLQPTSSNKETQQGLECPFQLDPTGQCEKVRNETHNTEGKMNSRKVNGALICSAW